MVDHATASPATGEGGSDAAADPAARQLLGLRIEPGGMRGHLDVTPALLNSAQVLWGGCGLAAAIAVGEQVLERDALWATVQYVRPIGADARLDLTVDVGQHGRGLSQASIRGTVDGRLALLATGTFGGRLASDPRDAARQIVRMPTDVKPPALAPNTPPRAGGVPTYFDLCPAIDPDAPGTEGRTATWLRPRTAIPPTVALLAVIADFAPAVLTKALGTLTYGVSLDNSIRVGPPPRSPDAGGRWILLDTQVEAFVRGVAQLNARLFDEDGNLLAIAGQSTLVRLST